MNKKCMSDAVASRSKPGIFSRIAKIRRDCENFAIIAKISIGLRNFRYVKILLG